MSARWDPADYRRSSAMQAGLAAEVLGRLALPPDASVLDVGCGDGKVTAALAARVPAGRVVGLDRSAEMLRFAREAFPPAQAPNLRFDLGDAADLRYDAEFDLVVSFAALHWVPDHAAVWRGIARALRPGGRAVVQCGGHGNIDAILPMVEAVSATPAHAPYLADLAFPWTFHDEPTARACVVGAGLVADRVALVPKTVSFEGREGLTAWLRTTWMPYTSRLPEAAREGFLAAIADRYLAAHPLVEGQARLPLVRLEIEAHRPA